ncbi:MAG: ACP phosphodiesterase [Desulfuromonadales bacterium]|jgi:acyl carrier protein phosphodiesterase|nr:ACP phosphodiesterase [Desulfuromonadales bacterium]
MNYLAHLYFSDPEPLAWAGSLMGDFLKGPLPEKSDPLLLKHLQLHRRIDSFAHGNPHFQMSCKRVAGHYRFGRGILIDVFYDHFLARNWTELADQPLEEFSQRVYAGLKECRHLMPEGMQSLLPRMARDNWLVSYRDESVVETVLSSLERRIRHRLPLARGIEELQLKRTDLERDFKGFIVEAGEFVGRWKAVY